MKDWTKGVGRPAPKKDAASVKIAKAKANRERKERESAEREAAKAAERAKNQS